MEVFCHINELGKSGWASLRTLVIACNRVVLWAPSASYLEMWRQQDPLLPDPNELLWYVKNKKIQILARDWWIQNGEQRRNNEWRHARRFQVFDEAVLETWEQDQREGRTGSATARVRIMPPETGLQWATLQVNSGAVNYREFLNKICMNDLLVGYRNRVKRASSEKEATLSLLRIVRNHGEALRYSGADRNFGSPANAQLLRVLAESAQMAGNAGPLEYTSPFTADKVLTIIKGLMEQIGKVGKSATSQRDAFDRTQTILEDEQEIKKVRELVRLADLLAASTSEHFVESEMAHVIADQLKAGAMNNKLHEYLMPRTAIERVVFLAGLIIGAAGLVGGGILAPIGLSLSFGPMVRGALQWLSFIPDSYSGPRWPFYLAEGSRATRRRSRERLVTALLELRYQQN